MSARSDVPTATYPPFRDPDDWRATKPTADMPGSLGPKARVLVADAGADHVLKHQHHVHPWCMKCHLRQDAAERQDAGSDPLRPPSELQRRLLEDVTQTITERHVDYAKDALERGSDFPANIAKRDGLTVDTIKALDAYASDLDDWDFSQAEAQTDTFERVLHYLILHGRAPVDAFDPDADVPACLEDELLDADQLDSLPTPEPLIAGVITRHSYAILRGRDGTFKSFTALDWGLCMATGKPWQGKQAEQVRVLYVAAEGAYGIAARVRAWEAGWGYTIDPKMFTVLPRAVNLFSAVELPALLRVVTEGRYVLVILDTMRRISGKADGNGSDMGTVVDNVDKVKRATDDGSVLVLTHTDKGDNDSRGFSGIEDDADIVWHNKFDDGRVRIKSTKMKDGPFGEEFFLTPMPVLDSIVLSKQADNLGSEDNTASQQAILYALANAFGQTDGASASELIETTGLTKSTFYWARGALLNTGQIQSNGPVGRKRLTLTQSNEVQPGDNALSSTFPTSPMESNGAGPVQSSPTPLIGVGRWTPDVGQPDTQEETT